MKRPDTITESWAAFRTNVTKGWHKEQIAAAHDMYMVGACDLGRIIFAIMSDKQLSGNGAAAKLKMIEAELEAFKVELATSSLRSQVNDKTPEMREALEIVKNRSN